jgi:sporulation protein YlmC with PRC-barrel domain
VLTLSENLLNQPVLSLRTGGVVATTLSTVFNPNNLKVEGFYCQDKLSKERLILLYQDIRNIISQGIIVNDHDALTNPETLVRLKDILKINFTLIGKEVITQDKNKVGKVKDYAVDGDSMYVQKLYVGKSIIKSFNASQLSVDRSQILEITDTKIIIQDLLKTSRVGVPATIAP